MDDDRGRLDSDLEARLTGVPVVRLLDHILARAQLSDVLEHVLREIALTTGDVMLELHFSDGFYRRSFVRAGPYGKDALEQRRVERHTPSATMGPLGRANEPSGPLIGESTAA